MKQEKPIIWILIVIAMVLSMMYVYYKNKDNFYQYIDTFGTEGISKKCKDENGILLCQKDNNGWIQVEQY